MGCKSFTKTLITQSEINTIPGIVRQWTDGYHCRIKEEQWITIYYQIDTKFHTEQTNG